MATPIIAIITGLPEEADAFAPGVGDRLSDRPFPVRAVTWRGWSVVLGCGGIGKVAAATAATHLASHYKANLVMVIGTAGALVPGEGAPRWLSSAVQHDYGAARADGFAHYRAGDWPIGPQGDPAFFAIAQPAGLGLAEAVIASGDCFLECPDHAMRLRTMLGASLVDMETAAVAQVAAMLELPWCAIKAATDEANADSAGDFNSNLARAARRAAEAAERAIALMAPSSAH